LSGYVTVGKPFIVVYCPGEKWCEKSVEATTTTTTTTTKGARNDGTLTD